MVKPMSHKGFLEKSIGAEAVAELQKSGLRWRVLIQLLRQVRFMQAARVLALLLLFTSPGIGQEAADYFRQNCMSCHTIGGGRLTGPDLKDVSQRRDRAWLAQFISNPQAAINSGDPYALKLFQEARNVIMPAVSGINRARAESMLDLIEAESKLEKSQFMGLQISSRPFTPEEINAGRLLFSGERRLANDGPSCMGCHSVNGVGSLGGGKLGPSLTKVYERLEGRKNLAAWLQAPATPTMQPVFRNYAMQPEEILQLVAFFEDSARTNVPETTVSQLNFFLLGMGGCVFGFIAFDLVWRQRFRAVRRPLVEGKRRGPINEF